MRYFPYQEKTKSAFYYGAAPLPISYLNEILDSLSLSALVLFIVQMLF
jgi:hypothetical protein